MLERPYTPKDTPALGGALALHRTASSDAIAACALRHDWCQDKALMTCLVKHCNMVWPRGSLFPNAAPFWCTSFLSVRVAPVVENLDLHAQPLHVLVQLQRPARPE